MLAQAPQLGVPDYLRYLLVHGKSPNTVSFYAGDLKHAPTLTAPRITAEDVTRWSRKTRLLGLACATVRRRHHAVLSYLTWRRDVLGEVDHTGLITTVEPVPKGRKLYSIGRVCDPRYTEALVVSRSWTKLRNAAVAAFVVGTGARAREVPLVGLADFRRPPGRVDRRLALVGNRVVRVEPEAIPVILAYLHHAREGCREARLFEGRMSGWLSHQAVGAAVAIHLRDVAVAGTAEDLRLSYGAVLLDRGASPQEAAEALGNLRGSGPDLAERVRLSSWVV